MFISGKVFPMGRSPDGPMSRLIRLAGVTLNIDDGTVLVQRGACAAGGAAGDVLDFFSGQLTRASAGEHSIRHSLI